MRKNIQLMPGQVNGRAFAAYSDCSFCLQIDDNGIYYLDGSQIGFIDDLEDYLDFIAIGLVEA